jgi:hypothetical protein
MATAVELDDAITRRKTSRPGGFICKWDGMSRIRHTNSSSRLKDTLLATRVHSWLEKRALHYKIKIKLMMLCPHASR